MSDAVDTRIVEAKFDASDFEKGVDKTVKKLDELKSKLEMKDTGKSIADFGKSATEGIEKSTNALEKLSERFTTFTGMIKQNLLGGLANQISDVFLSIERSITGLFRELGSSQVSAGMSKYTEILTSVRTMTASGVSQSAAYEQIKRLAEYSDQTSYSLSQMTSGMSKLVAAGAKLEDAEKMMEGLANMSASAGVNIYDAQRAFTNFSQAYSSGSMRIQDWMSLENLNMATKEVMQVFMEAGVKSGTLVKEVKKNNNGILQDTYKTSNKINKKVKANKQVAASGFRDTLSSGWLDQETMKVATAMLSYFDDLGISLNDLSKEQLSEFATRAFQAAKEARSFTDVLGTIKDAVSTGWANTFEQIFGKLDKATEFFTWLSESNLAEAIYSIGEYRNEVLSIWNQRIGTDITGTSGSELLKSSLMNIDELIGSVTKAFSDLMPYPTTLGAELHKLTKRFYNFTRGMKEWINETDPVTGKTRAQKFAESFSIIGSAFSIAGRIIQTAWGGIKTVFTALEPTFDAIAIVLKQFSESVDSMNRNTTIFDDLSNGIQNIVTIAQPLLDVLPTVLSLAETIGSLLLGMAIDTVAMNVQLFADALGLLIELFGGTSAQQMNEGQGVLEGIAADIKSLGDAASQALGAVKGFFTALFDDIRTMLGLNEETGEATAEEGGLWKNIKDFFSSDHFTGDVKDWINKVVENVSNWVSQAVTDVKNFIMDLPSKIHDGMKNLGSLIGAIWNGLFYEDKTISPNGDVRNVDSPKQMKRQLKLDKPLKKWIDQAIIDVKKFIVNIPKYVAQGLKSTGDILSSMISAIFGKENGDPVTSEDIIVALKKPFENLTLSSVIDKIKNIGLEMFNGVMSVFTGTDDLEKNQETFANSLAEGIGNLKDAASKKWDEIKQWFIDLPETIAGLFSNERTAEEIKENTKDAGPIEKAITAFVNAVGQFIGTDLPEGIKTAFTEASELIGGFWESLYKVITGQTEDKQAEGAADAAVTAIDASAPEASDVKLSKWNSLFTAIGGKLRDMVLGLPTFATQAFEILHTLVPIDKWVNDFGSWIGELWTGIHEEIRTDTKGNKYTYIEKNIGLKDQLIGLAGDVGTWITVDFPKKVKKWSSDFGTWIKELWTGIHEEVRTDANGNKYTYITKTDGIKDHLLGYVDSISSWIRDELPGKIEHIGKMISGFFKDIMYGPEEIAEYLDQEGMATTVVKRNGGLADKIASFVTETVPKALTDAWKWVSSKSSEWYTYVENVLNDNGINWETVQESATNIGNKIAGFIKDIPGYINTAFNGIQKLLFGPEQIVEYLDEEGMATTFMKRSGGLWENFLKPFGDSIGQVFVEAGPTIVEGLNKALIFAGDKLDIAAAFIRGNEEGGEKKSLIQRLEEAAETDQFAAAVLNLGQTIKRIIVETIPNFVNAAFEEIKMSIPSLINTLFGGLFEDPNQEAEINKQVEENGKAIKKTYNALAGEYVYVAEATEKKIGTAKGLGDVMMEMLNPVAAAKADTLNNGEKITDGITVIGDIIGRLNELAKTTDIGSVATLAMIALILTKVTDMFSIADEIEAVTYGIGFAGIGVAFAGLAAMLAQVVYLAGQTTEDGKNAKLDAATQVLDKVGNFITTLADKIVLLAGLWKGLGLVSDVLDVVTTFSEGGAVKKGLSAMAGLGIGTLMSQMVTGLIGGLGGSLNDLATEIQTFADVLGPALVSLANMDAPLTTALAIPKKLKEFIESFWEVSFNMYEALADSETGDQGHISFQDYADSYVDQILGISVFMNNLSSSLKTFSELGDLGSILDTITKMRNVIMNDAFKGLLQEIGKSIVTWFPTQLGGDDQLRNMSLEFELLGNAFGVFDKAILELDESHVNAFGKILDTFNRLAEAFGGDQNNVIKDIASGKSDIAKFGRELQQMAVNMKYFAKYISEIDVAVLDVTKYQEFIAKVDLVAHILTTFINASLGLKDMVYFDQLDTLSDNMPALSESIVGLINGLNSGLDADIDLGKMRVLESALGAFDHLISSLYTSSIMDLREGGASRIIGNMKEFIRELTEETYMPTWEDNAGATNYLSGFFKLISSSLSGDAASYSPVVTITPIVDTNKLDQQLNAYFAGRTFELKVQASLNAALQAGSLNIKIPEPINYKGHLSMIEGQISALSGKVGDLASAISRQTFNINVGGSGAVSGSDYGRRNTLIERTPSYIP